MKEAWYILFYGKITRTIKTQDIKVQEGEENTISGTGIKPRGYGIWKKNELRLRSAKICHAIVSAHVELKLQSSIPQA